MKTIRLPYFNERNAKIDSIIIHCLAYDVENAVESFKQNEVSPHYLIDERGKVYHFVDDKKRAWHAGKSFWQGKTDLNDCSIGIELCSKSFGQEAYPLGQMKALISLCQRLKRKYHIKKERILGHSDISPLRKADPGKAFPWAYLARHNLGVWYDVRNAAKFEENNLAMLLENIGYDVSDMKAAKTAFVRHYMGKCVEDDTLENLLQKPENTPVKVDEEEFIRVLKAVAYSFLDKKMLDLSKKVMYNKRS